MQILAFPLLQTVGQYSIAIPWHFFKMGYRSISADKHVPNKLDISISVKKQKKMSHIHMSPVTVTGQFQNK